jgi:acetyl-CoA carboxylase biotin carboxyl carrier protein
VNLSPDDVEDILKILDSTEYDELELETDRFVLRLKRGPGGWTAEHEVHGRARLLEPHLDEAPSSEGEDRTSDASQTRAGLYAVRAPLPGVFYRAPKPGEAPFVEVGDLVEEGHVVAILETMKLMNPVRAGQRGRVEEIVVSNGEAVEQNAALMWLAPLARGEQG